jgi:hypothetical protein
MSPCTRSPRTRSKRHLRTRIWTVSLFAACGACAFAQAAAPETPQAERATTLANATARRDAFIARIHAAGFACPIAAPAIVVEDVPSWGQYNDANNTLRTSDWTVLRPEEKAFFVHLAGPGADDAAARAVFEKAAHGWIFVHELGHWWQACRGFLADHSHYQVESGANRIALAYWRETDPEIAALMMSLFHGVLDHAPSPVPAGQSVEEYFNKNYETLGPSPAYPWFQSQMGVSLEQEKPAPTLVEALAETKK